MSHETIGTAARPFDNQHLLDGSNDDIAFSIPYGDNSYAVIFSQPELNKIFQTGMEKILGNQALAGFDYDVRLPNGDLPLFIGARAIRTSGSEGKQNVNMDVGVVTQSVVHEHRGILRVKRHTWDGRWVFTDYRDSPPLKDRDEAIETGTK